MMFLQHLLQMNATISTKWAFIRNLEIHPVKQQILCRSIEIPTLESTRSYMYQTSCTCNKNIHVKDFSTFLCFKNFYSKNIYLATIPFIRIRAGVLRTKQIWYVDDFAPASSLSGPRKQWGSITNEEFPIDCFFNSQSLG